jgi:hypothetical protein
VVGLVNIVEAMQQSIAQLEDALVAEFDQSWRSTPCGRSAGETGEPVEATPSGGDVVRPPRLVAAAGLPDRRPAPLHPGPHPCRDGPRRALRDRLGRFAENHPLWGYRRAHAVLRREGWVLNRKEDPAPVARRRAAGAVEAPQASAARPRRASGLS